MSLIYIPIMIMILILILHKNIYIIISNINIFEKNLI